MGGSLQPNHIGFLDPPIELEDDSRRRRECYASEDVVLLYVGRVIREKGLGDVLEAMMKLSDNVKFLIVGDGENIVNLKSTILNLGIKAGRVIFAGKVSYEDIVDYYSLADIFVFPTHREEGFPMTLVEAQACGLPVVVADKGGSREAVEEGKTGLIYESGNTDHLFQKLFELVSSPPLRTSMSHNARVRAENLFSQDRMVAETLKVLESVIG